MTGAATMNGRYQQARFLTSAPSLAHAPPDAGVEVAFAGRSNAGKSSALNALTNRRALARTSRIPGRTQLLNFFRLDERRRLVDLPGYGYARVPEAVRRQWQRTIEDYLNARRSLRGVVLVMDVRHPLTERDRQLVAWCGGRGLPAHALFTKADKLSRGAAIATLAGARRNLAELHPQASAQLFSAVQRTGVEELQALLDRWLQLPEK